MEVNSTVGNVSKKEVKLAKLDCLSIIPIGEMPEGKCVPTGDAIFGIVKTNKDEFNCVEIKDVSGQWVSFTGDVVCDKLSDFLSDFESDDIGMYELRVFSKDSRSNAGQTYNVLKVSYIG